MRNAFLTSVLLLMGAFAWRPAIAQDALDSSRDLLRAGVRDRVVLADTVSTFRTRRVPGGRLDVEEGIFRSRYRIGERVDRGLPPAEAALQHVRLSAESYGIQEGTENLKVESIRTTPSAQHVRLRQMLKGVPVYGREVMVNLDKSGQPTMVINGYAPHLDRVDGFDATPRISGSQAVRIVQNASERGLDTADPELVVYPSKPPRLAWRLDAAMRGVPVQYEALVDARSGEIIRMLDVTLHRSAPADRGPHIKDQATDLAAPTDPALPEHHPSSPASGRWPAVSRSASHQADRRSAQPHPTSVRAVDGSGYVFDPDPLTTAGAEYGGEFVDGGDADTDALTSQLFEVTLRDISEGSDGLYRLEGPYVIIDGSGTGYVPPAEPSPDGFKYTRSSDYFEAVMAYYHIDKSQRYIQSLDVGFPIREEPVVVNPQGTAEDDSNFDLNNLIRFGTGGIDDAEDADVIWHEYAHALLDDVSPGLYKTFEGKALHEGWGDYWAASYSRHLSEDDDQIPVHDWERVYTWDGNWTCWPGRTLDHDGTYPNDMNYTAPGCQNIFPIYQWGLHWATTLMEIYPHVGRPVLDRLNLASHAYLAESATLADAAEALIQADKDLYAGAHSNVLIHYLDRAGYVHEELYGPVITHEPLAATEQTGGSVRIEATVAQAAAAVDSVVVLYGADGNTSNRIILQPEGGAVYAGELPLPDEQAIVTYYIEAVDVEGRRRRLPASAPEETFAFAVGPDRLAPVITHQPHESVSVIGWPADLYVQVEDNVGVDSVWVEYSIETAGGAPQESGAFALEADEAIYAAMFPAPVQEVEGGGAVTYRIFARDFAQAANVAVLPTDGSFRIPIVENGVFRRYDMEGINEGIISSGTWERGAPEFGLRVAHSGDAVWATRIGAAYPGTPQVSRLRLPAFNLGGLEQAYLVFWHWYDFEHDGGAEPGSFNPAAGIWDGGNVKVSVDGGETWSIVEPEGGYNGRLADGYGNPMAGEEAFGGYSFGWRREIAPLPIANDVRIRFDFGTDESNENESRYFAGWYIDDISITTNLPADDSPPEAAALPPSHDVRIPQMVNPPEISIEAFDDTGIEAVISEYEMTLEGETTSGSVRLAMSDSDRNVFHGAIVPSASFSAGDRIEYRLVVRDFDGNEAVFGDPFVVDIRAEQAVSALDSAVPTGAWMLEGNTWTAARSIEGPVSSLVLEPFTLPSNAESATLVVEHSFTLGQGLGGNVKISTDDGKTWGLLQPEGGYPKTLEATHAMQGQGVFGDTSGVDEARFDLSAHAGKEIRIRFDMAQSRPLESGEGWRVTDAVYRSLSPNPDFVTPLELELHANFPDPVLDRTTITYTIPEQMAARLSVYDMLGRRVALLRHARHEPGTYTVTYDAEGLASGAYIIHLETTMGSRTENMVVVH